MGNGTTMATQTPVTERPRAAGTVAPAHQEVVLERSSGWPSLRLRELWRAHELVYFLIWRDVKVRYKQTVLGVAWAVLQPLLTVVVFTLFFHRVARISSGSLPYPVFSLAGLVPWLFFSNAISLASQSVVANANVLTKIYFPRLAIPLATTLAGAPDFAIGFVLLLIVMAGYGVAPGLTLFALPAFFLLVLVTALGVALWLSALNVLYRDVRYIVPIAVQLWLLATPIAYSVSGLHSPWNVILGLNPMAGAVEGFRWAATGGAAPPAGMLALSAAVAAIVAITGAYYFRAMERRFADVI
jgi:lipopolysaccharide transport system permease protein